MESRPVWEYQYKSVDVSPGLIRKFSKCTCGCVTSHDLETLTSPSKMIQVYNDSKPSNTVTILYSSEHNKALAVFDDIAKQHYQILMFDDSATLYSRALEFFNNKPFQILSSHPMPKLPNISVDQGLSAALLLIHWQTDNHGFIKELIRSKLAELVSYFNLKPGYTWYQMKNITDLNQKSVLTFLNSDNIDYTEFIKFFKRLAPKE